MKVFISWSGVRSHQVSSFLQDVLRQVFGEIQFYLSSDMSGGVRWSKSIFDSMEICDIGIIVFTPENKFEPWVMFEAGCLARKANSLVIPVYVDCVFHSIGPLHEFQGVTLKTHAKEDDDRNHRGNMAAIIKIIESITRHLPASSSKESIRLRYLADQTWWKTLNKRLGDASRVTTTVDATEPAEETPVLAYPHYRSTVTFDAMTRAVQETDSFIGLSSMGLMLYWDHAPFRKALESRVLTDPRIELRVILKDPATHSYVDQYKQMMGKKTSEKPGYDPEDLFKKSAFRPGVLKKQLYPLPESYYKADYHFSFADITKYMPEERTLTLFAKLYQVPKNERKGKFTLKLYKEWFLHAVIVFDHELYVFPYGVDHEAIDAPLFRFLPHQIGFQYFRDQFFKIEENSYPVKS